MMITRPLLFMKTKNRKPPKKADNPAIGRQVGNAKDGDVGVGVGEIEITEVKWRKFGDQCINTNTNKGN